MNELETGLPNFRQVQEFIKENQGVEIKLLTGDLMTGTVFWQDTHCICLRDDSEQPVTIWRHAIAYLKHKG
ncbi:MAG: RNA-binding protein hfq [Cyanobacteriota bacterium]|nr:RNA-binding protein hfq [Cyanobacteriota bacterium]